MDGTVLELQAQTLNELARRIEDQAHALDDQVLAVARLLQEARRRVNNGEAGTQTWWQWAAKNIRLQKSRLRELMHIADAEDPIEALTTLRKRGLQRVQKHREKKTNARCADMDPARRHLHEWVDAAPIREVILVGDALRAGMWPPSRHEIEAVPLERSELT